MRNKVHLKLLEDVDAGVKQQLLLNRKIRLLKRNQKEKQPNLVQKRKKIQQRANQKVKRHLKQQIAKLLHQNQEVVKLIVRQNPKEPQVHQRQKQEAKLGLLQQRVQRNKPRPIASPKPRKQVQKATVSRPKRLAGVSQQKPSETI